MAKKRLKIPSKGLFTIIDFLLKKKILIEGSKLTKESVLLNQYRKRIYKFIKNNPGVHFSIVRKKVFSDNKGNIGSTGQFIWHLEILLKFNYIKKVKVNNYTIFLPIEIDEELGKFYFLLREKINKKIGYLLIKHEKIKISEVHKHINEKRANIYYRIKNLIDYNIISLLGDDNREICLNPEKKEIFLSIYNKISKLNERKIVLIKGE